MNAGRLYRRPSMAERPDAVLFDFDGVLVHSEPLHFLAFKAVADREHLTLTEELYYNELLGFDDRGAVLRLLTLNHKPTTPSIVLRLLAEKQKVAAGLIHERHYEALSGVEATVRGLWRNYPLAVCSGARSTEIELMLDAVRLRDCFRVIVSAEDVKIGKPDPQCYQRALEMLTERFHSPFDARRCVVFEDAPRVLDRLKPLGFYCVGLAGHIPPERFTSADVVLTSLNPAEVKAKLPHLELYEG
ncbi:MAG TPA: HAD family phosphatase [Tepidisphaeraceae bacterium]|jgi:beta-phosphoglucomutase